MAKVRAASGGERPLRVLVAGASGRMGRETVKAVRAAPDMELVGAVSRGFASRTGVGAESGLESELVSAGVAVAADLETALSDWPCDVLVEFTAAEAAPAHLRAALEAGVRPVSGTTGVSAREIEVVRNLAEERGLGAAVIPNFSLGATVLAIAARTAAPYFRAAEIIELHHDRKRDAPSGTALALARTVARELGREAEPEPGAGSAAADSLVAAGRDQVSGGAGRPSRGLEVDGIPVHSVRLSGLVAHHELVFASNGETLTIRHDSVDRSSFMPGVLLAARTISRVPGLVTSLEELLALSHR